jgi:hypothetical protein
MIILLLKTKLFLDRFDGTGLQFMSAAMHRQYRAASIEHHRNMAAFGWLECCAELF